MTYDPLLDPFTIYKPSLTMDNITITTALTSTTAITTNDPTTTTMMSLLKTNKNSSLLSLKDKNMTLDITENDFRMFVEFMQIYETTHECDDYCKGDFFKFLQAYTNIHGYVALMVCIFGTIANILNIMVLTKKDMAKAPINKILKWLAVADMLVMIEYIPFVSYQYIYMTAGEKDFSYAWAVYILFHMHFTQVMHTISIGLTVTLAIWRYVAISY